ACGFRDSYEDFKEFGAEVIGISSDSAASHQKFSSKYDLPFVFLSDEDNEGRKKFGVKANLLGLLPGRETFVFDKEGILRFRFNSINAKRHIPKALKAIRQISEK
ncbi:MAG: peroxiredoxin, partial [Salegentibacter sp.]